MDRSAPPAKHTTASAARGTGRKPHQQQSLWGGALGCNGARSSPTWQGTTERTIPPLHMSQQGGDSAGEEQCHIRGAATRRGCLLRGSRGAEGHDGRQRQTGAAYQGPNMCRHEQQGDGAQIH